MYWTSLIVLANILFLGALLALISHFCDWKQVRLPAATKANTREAGADVKESGLFSGARHLEDGGLMSQSLSPGKTGHSLLQVLSPPLSRGRGVYKEGGEQNKEIKAGGWKGLYVQTSAVRLVDEASEGPEGVILAPISQMPEGRRVYFEVSS